MAWLKFRHPILQLRHDANAIARAHRLKFTCGEMFAMFMLINYCNNRLVERRQLIFPDKRETNPRLGLWHFSHFYGPFTAFLRPAQYDDTITMMIVKECPHYQLSTFYCLEISQKYNRYTFIAWNVRFWGANEKGCCISWRIYEMQDYLKLHIQSLKNNTFAKLKSQKGKYSLKANFSQII